jgi:hypothetical protein
MRKAVLQGCWRSAQRWLTSMMKEQRAGVQGQCAALTHRKLCGNNIRAAGAESLAGVLLQCTALADLALYSNLERKRVVSINELVFAGIVIGSLILN